jgi:hypothetical protein
MWPLWFYARIKAILKWTWQRAFFFFFFLEPAKISSGAITGEGCATTSRSTGRVAKKIDEQSRNHAVITSVSSDVLLWFWLPEPSVTQLSCR